MSSKIEIIIKYNIDINKFRLYPTYDYRIIKSCCKSFKVACDENYIGVDDDLYSETHFRFALSQMKSGPGECWDEWSYEIHFCPFCGEKFNFEVKERISEIAKKIEKYNKQKTHFLKGLNKILLLIRYISKYDENPTKKDFVYKYGMNKFIWLLKDKVNKFGYYNYERVL